MSLMLDPNNEKVGHVLVSAVRYACCRQTYMPGIVVSVILPRVSSLNDKILCCMERDIANQERYGGYGDDCDKKEWMKLLDALTAEREKRGLERWK